jgi:hypothetical protein
MKGQRRRDVVAQLAKAAVLQDACAEQRLALEWGELMFAQLVRRWNYLEAQECCAYEDKVTAQVRMMEEATATLRRLHRMLVHMRRLLKQHQRELRQPLEPQRRDPREDAHAKAPARRRRASTVGSEER